MNPDVSVCWSRLQNDDWIDLLGKQTCSIYKLSKQQKKCVGPSGKDYLLKI